MPAPPPRPVPSILSDTQALRAASNIVTENDYGSSDEFEEGSILHKIKVAKLEQIQKLIADYGSGKLLERWKEWFMTHQPNINMNSVEVAVKLHELKHLENFFKAGNLTCSLIRDVLFIN